VKWFGWLRSPTRTPDPAWTIATQDVNIAYDVGLSYLDWMDLTDERRTWYRANHIKATITR
jgi:hypothetical protein